MNQYLISAAVILVLSFFTIFHFDNDYYLQAQAEAKSLTNDCANAAALYYEYSPYGDGFKIFRKEDGNAAIARLLRDHFEQEPDYIVYYFDGNGDRTIYEKGTFVSKEPVGLPHHFEETATGYQRTVDQPTVIVTLQEGTYDFRLNFLPDPELIRTSAYEAVAY